jgi:hypothetical protein
MGTARHALVLAAAGGRHSPQCQSSVASIERSVCAAQFFLVSETASVELAEIAYRNQVIFVD